MKTFTEEKNILQNLSEWNRLIFDQIFWLCWNSERANRVNKNVYELHYYFNGWGHFPAFTAYGAAIAGVIVVATNANVACRSNL